MSPHHGFIAAGTATLALATAMFFATFTLVDAILLAPPPFANPAQVVLYGQMPGAAPRRGMSTALYDMVGMPPMLLSRGLAAATTRASASAQGHAALLAVQRVDAGYLPTLGVAPADGVLTFGEDGEDVVVLSWRLWQAWFGGERVAGQAIMVDGRAFPVAGVLPQAFRVFDDVDIFLPLRPVAGGGQGTMANGIAVGRLAPGASASAFGAVVRGIAAAHASALGMPADAVASVGATPIEEAVRGYAAPTLWQFLRASLLVMATACANLANLLLAQGWRRGRETAMRTAFGAPPWRAAMPVACDAAIVGVAGTVAALLLGNLLLGVLRDSLPRYWLPDAGTIRASAHVYVATVGLAVVVTMVAAVVGAWLAGGDRLLREHMGAAGARPHGRVAQRVRGAMVQWQLALATILAAFCAVQFVHASGAWRPPPGMPVEGIALARFHPDAGHFDTVPRIAALANALARDASQRDGASAAGVTTQLPTGPRFVVAFPGIAGAPIEVRLALQTPGVRAAMGLHLLAGRDIDAGDTAGSEPVAVVNEAFIATVQGAGLGTVVEKMSRGLGSRPLRIVGIVANDRAAGDTEATRPAAIVPFAQLPAREFSAYRGLLAYFIVARLGDEAQAVGHDTGASLRRIAPWLVAEPSTMARAWHDAAAGARRDAWQALLLAALATGLATLGFHSALGVQLAARQRDLALAAALGASPWQLCTFGVLRGGAGAVPGIAAGAALVVASPLPWSAPAVATAGAGMLVLCILAALPALHRAAAAEPWRVVREA
ncbi:ABC transporter permease [Luteibacter yeojuensis]|uniref:Uncharacterized protein n=1 Tax=Luteibacter yeojuensis TaxID=345309 RepID=A0A0F3KXV2_9GAMM|nr:ABC transporter permease [Luteibacter yeojuensis]KJV35792.1 hypothetical protein VI08_07335 [Luteibacter yeojuensis]